MGFKGTRYALVRSVDFLYRETLNSDNQFGSREYFGMFQRNQNLRTLYKTTYELSRYNLQK